MPRADDPVQRSCAKAFAIALSLAALHVGCAKDPPPAQPERIARPAFRSTLDHERASQRRVVARLEVPAEVEPWTTEAGEHRVKTVELEGGKRSSREIMLLGRAEKTLTIPLASPTEPFNRVEVVMRIARADSLELELSIEGRELAFVTHALRASPKEQIVAIDVPYPTALSADRLVLRVSREGPVTFGPIELVHAPWRDRLPPPEGPARLIEIAADVRRAVGVSSARSMEGTFDVKGPAVLAFAYGTPSALTHAVSSANVRVEITADGVPADETRFPLTSGDGAPPAWRTAMLPLKRFDGKRVRVRLSIESTDPDEVVCAISEPEVFVPDARASTVLLITSDTHRADHLGHASRDGEGASGLVSTPALDRLAQRALVFDTCFSSSNVTIPSHVAIMTGTHPRDTRIVHNSQLLADEAHTLAERFREAGFATVAAISASHLDDAASGLGQGFDRIATTREAKRRAATTLAALRPALDEASGKPLFIWLHLFDAHTPYAPPPPFDRAYYARDKDPFAADLPAPALDPRLFPTNMPGLKDLEYPASQYRGEVSYLDAELASLLAMPRIAQGIVAFTADHGESFGAHGVWWEHAELYPETIHVPLVIAYPGVAAQTRVRSRVNQLDLGRTLLDLAGLGASSFPGVSLLSDTARTRAETVYTLSAYGFSASITSGPWHLILHLETHPIDPARVQPFKQKHEVELFNLDDDPRAERDLARTDHARAQSLRAALIHWLVQRSGAGLKTDAAQDAETIARLAELGYTSPAVTHDAEEPWFDVDCACSACALFE